MEDGHTWIKNLQTSCRFSSNNCLHIETGQRSLFKWYKIQTQAFPWLLLNEYKNSRLEVDEERMLDTVYTPAIRLNVCLFLFYV